MLYLPPKHDDQECGISGYQQSRYAKEVAGDSGGRRVAEVAGSSENQKTDCQSSRNVNDAKHPSFDGLNIECVKMESYINEADDKN